MAEVTNGAAWSRPTDEVRAFRTSIVDLSANATLGDHPVDDGAFGDAVEARAVSIGGTPGGADDLQASLERWATDELESRGLVVIAPVSNPRLRPWCTVLRIETSGGVVWAKQASAGARYEAGLLRVLAEVCPDVIVTPLAVDASSGRVCPNGPASGDVVMRAT